MAQYGVTQRVPSVDSELSDGVDRPGGRGLPDLAVERLTDELLAFSRVVVAHAARVMAGEQSEVTLPQYRALVLLGSRGPCRSTDLATELEVRPSTITRMCDRLVRRGLVRRFRRADDRRASWLELTASGRELMGAMMRLRRAEIARLVAVSGVTDPAAVAGALAALVRAAGESSETAWWQLVGADDPATALGIRTGHPAA